MQVSLAYDDTISINLNVYGELANAIEKGNVYSMISLKIHNYCSQGLLKIIDPTQITISSTIQKRLAVLLILKGNFKR